MGDFTDIKNYSAYQKTTYNEKKHESALFLLILDKNLKKIRNPYLMYYSVGLNGMS
jgi:hypothetical protein